MLTRDFFDRDPIIVAKDLLGKLLCVYQENIWLTAMIIETEAYYITDKASHASLGFTQKRSALFMPAGTIYMYYARGGDSLNISCCGKGNAVLIKSALPYIQENPDILTVMQKLNPDKKGNKRPLEKLCAGQTLLCKSLGLKVLRWDQQQFDEKYFLIKDINYRPKKIIQTTRLGIPLGRDEHLPYRFIDFSKADYSTNNPLRKRNKEDVKIIDLVAD